NPVRISAGHLVTITSPTAIDIPSLQFNAGSVLDFTNTCDFVTQSMGIVSVVSPTAIAPARIRVTTSSSDSTEFPGGNWTPFLNNGQTNVFVQFYYSGTSFRIPNYSQYNQNQLSNFAGLEIDHGPGEIQLPNQSLVMNSFNVFSTSGTGGRCFNSTETAIRNIQATNGWTVGNNGHFQFSSRAGMVRRDHYVSSNNAACTLSVASTGRLSVESNAGDYQQYMWFNEGFTNEGTIDFMPMAITNARVWMCVGSSRNTTFQGNGTTRVPRLYIDRTTKTVTVTNSNAGFVFANPSTGGNIGIQLVTGTYIQNHSNINWVMKTGVNPGELSINANSHLIIRAGTAAINATGTNAGLRVDGSLTIDGTGKLKLLSNPGVDNYLGVGTAGAFITIATSDSVIIGSQLKGIGMVAAPNFTMRSGTLVVGRQGAPDLTRGMFAVAGTNSRFKVSGGKIVVMRSVGQPSVFDVNIQPDSTPVYTGGTFQVGSSLMASGANFLVRNSHGFYSLRLVNSGSLNPTLDNRNFNLTVFENDTIDAGTTCLMNNLDLNIGGSLVKNGTYSGGTGTVRFNGSGSAQSLSGSGTLTCTNFESANTNGTASVLTVDIPVTISTALTVSSLDNVSLGSNTMTVSRTVTNNGEISTSSGKLLLNGTLKQIVTGTNGAQFGKTEFANNLGFDLQRSFVFNGDVVLTTGIIDLLANRMSLGQNAVFQGTGLGTTKYIKVNGALTDAGITKNFAAGAATILIPVGVNPSIGVVKYTPAYFNIQQNTAVSSSITLRAINDKHPNTLSSNNSELRYYWKVDSTGFANLQANMTFNYDQSDANSRGNENDYDPARYGPTGNWAIGGFLGTIDVGTNTIIVDGGNTGYVTYIGGDYTAGEPDEFISLIPYLTNGTGGGNWEIASTWALNVVPMPGSAIRVVGTDILTATANSKSASAVILEDAATLNLASTTGHNLGTILGKGKIALATANLPTGNYATFTQTGGGTIEYRGSVTLPVSRVVYNNLIINVPSGVVSMPNASLTINGNMTVQNGTLQSLTNRRITLYGNLVVENGSTFTAGNGSSNEQFRLAGNLTNDGTITSGNTRFVLFGGLNQNIGGTQIPVLNYLEMSKSGRKAYLVNNLRLQTQLAFNSGILVLGTYNLVLNNNTLLIDPDGSSYVQAEQSGKIIRPITSVPVNASYAVYPVGDALSYKPITIQLNAAGLTGSSQLEVNLTSAAHPGMSNDVTRYLPFYWSVRPGGMTGPFSYNISYTTGQHSDIVIIRDSDPNPIKAYKWDSELGWLKGGSYNETTAIFTWNGITSFSDFTGGTQLEDLPLPVHLVSFTGHMDARRKVVTQWQTASERNMSHFTVERLDARGNVTALGKIQPMSRTKNQENGGFRYQFTDEDPVEGRGYYRLKMVDLDGSYSYSSTIAVQLSMEGLVKHYPNPLHHSAVTFDFPAGENDDLDWKILDATGREIAKGNLEANGSRTVSLEETKELLPGFYFIHLEKGEVKTNLRIIVR
ncbi:MAG TPA: T9SS type A sorting domain-containing protein, partial [Catalimonadaceae bacterium]|nr:T9SS type A sorting domain-containing protein [Catalimonadaceae bacterium]